MKVFLAGSWVDKSNKIEVRNPFDNSIIDTVPKADSGDVETALAFAERGAKVMAKLSSYDRWKILRKAADLMAARNEELGQTISKEEGKIIAEGRGEASRAVETMMGSAEEAKRLHGETVPLDADPTGGKKLGFTLRVPCGVVAAIAPFNFPLNLVCHKVGPALAAGNSVIVKPASDTPLSALRLTEILLEAGLPPEGIQCIPGSGGEIGDLIIMPDADLEKVAAAVVMTGYGNAGQTCISTQRVLTSKKIYGDFLGALKPKVEALTTGNQLDESSKVGPMVKESEAVRVDTWINEAVASGARLVAGGGRRGAIYMPAVVADVKPEMRISRDELFGPAVGVAPFNTIEEAIALANDSVYGLAAGIFTENVEWAMKFAREAEAGNLHVNWGPQWRVDLMPYGGLKDSGFGKEGPRYAVEEMTELKMVVFHLNS